MKYFYATILLILLEVFVVHSMAEKQEDELVERLISGLSNVLQSQGGRVTHLRAPKLPRFSGKFSPGELTLSQWLEEVDIYCDQCDIPSSQKAQVILNHLDGDARQEVKCHSISHGDADSLINLLKRHFGTKQTVQSLQKRFYERVQHEGETLDQFSRALMCMYDDIIDAAPTNESSYKGLRDSALIDKFVAGARSQSTRLELRRIQLANPGKTFLEIRDHALDLLDSFDIQPTSIPSIPKRGAVCEVSVDECSEGADSIPMHTDKDLIKQLVKQQAALEQCMRQQQVILERQQEQLSNLTAQQNQASVQYPRQKRVLNCYHCGKPGHVRSKCWELQNELYNRNHNSHVSGHLNANPPL